MTDRIIEDAINDVLSGETRKNALELISFLRAADNAERFVMKMYDDSGCEVSNLGFIVIGGSDDFPDPWTMWIDADNLGGHLQGQEFVDERIKEFAWAHVAPCGSCGGQCSPGTTANVFGRQFENTCRSQLMFTNPDADAVECMKKIIGIKAGA